MPQPPGANRIGWASGLSVKRQVGSPGTIPGRSGYCKWIKLNDMQNVKLSDGFTDRVMQKIAYREKVCRTRRRIMVAVGSVLGAACLFVGVAIYIRYTGAASYLSGSGSAPAMPEWLQHICDIVTVSIPAWLQTFFSAATPSGPELIQTISGIVNHLSNMVAGFFSSVGSIFAGVDKNILIYPAIVLLLAAAGYLLDRRKSSRHSSSIL